MKHNRNFLIVMVWLLAAVCLLSCVMEAPPVHSLDHDCTGEGCPVCLCISLREVLASLTVLLAAVHLAICLARVPIRGCRPLFSPRRWTPVFLKVKLSN